MTNNVSRNESKQAPGVQLKAQPKVASKGAEAYVNLSVFGRARIPALHGTVGATCGLRKLATPSSAVVLRHKNGAKRITLPHSSAPILLPAPPASQRLHLRTEKSGRAILCSRACNGYARVNDGWTFDYGIDGPVVSWTSARNPSSRPFSCFSVTACAAFDARFLISPGSSFRL
jgi:hypothetical protein